MNTQSTKHTCRWFFPAGRSITTCGKKAEWCYHNRHGDWWYCKDHYFTFISAGGKEDGVWRKESEITSP